MHAAATRWQGSGQVQSPPQQPSLSPAKQRHWGFTSRALRRQRSLAPPHGPEHVPTSSGAWTAAEHMHHRSTCVGNAETGCAQTNETPRVTRAASDHYLLSQEQPQALPRCMRAYTSCMAIVHLCHAQAQHAHASTTQSRPYRVLAYITHNMRKAGTPSPSPAKHTLSRRWQSRAPQDARSLPCHEEHEP